MHGGGGGAFIFLIYLIGSFSISLIASLTICSCRKVCRAHCIVVALVTIFSPILLWPIIFSSCVPGVECQKLMIPSQAVFIIPVITSIFIPKLNYFGPDLPDPDNLPLNYYVSLEVASKLTSKAQSDLLELINMKEIPSKKIDDRWYILKSDIPKINKS